MKAFSDPSFLYFVWSYLTPVVVLSTNESVRETGGVSVLVTYINDVDEKTNIKNSIYLWFTAGVDSSDI